MKKLTNKNLANPIHTACWRITMGFIFSLLSSMPFGEGFGGNIFAQQLPFSSQYYTNPFVMNPAYAGINDNINAYITHRSQWTGLAGAPQTSYFTIDGPIPAKNSSLGLKIYSDVTDIISRAGVFANYAYRIKISDSNNLYLGVACGVFNNKIDFSKAQVPDPDDPFLSQQSQNKTIVSADLGVVYVYKKLTVGFAVPQLLGNRVKYPILSGDNSYYNLNRHYQGSAKYLFNVSKEKEITAYPLFMFRYVKGAPFQYDVNGVIDWKKIGWVGLTYHSNYAVAISGGIRYHNFCVGYAYDMGISKIKSYTGSSSEFLLGYVYGQKKKETDRFVNVEEPRIDIAALGGNGKIDSSKVISQLKADDERNQAEIKRLKTELEKSKEVAVTPTNKDNDAFNEALAAKLKAIAEANQKQIDSLKAELEKSKVAATANKGSNETKPMAYISIRLIDDKGNPLSDVQVEVVDKSSDQMVAKPQVNADGYTRVSLPPGKKYDIIVSKSGYLFKTVNVEIPDKPGYEKKLEDIKLEKVEVGKKIVLNNISFDINKSTLKKESFSELNNAVKLMKDIPSLEMEISGYTDNLGSAKFNQQLSKQRAKAVMDYLISQGSDPKRLTYKGYGSAQPIASNDTREGREMNRRTEFKVLKVGDGFTVTTGTSPLKSPESVENEKELTDNSMPKLEAGKKIVLENISFEINQPKLQKESYSELEKVIKLMKDVPSLEIEIAGHTDNLGSVKNNQKLSEERAKSITDYLVSKGVDKKRVTYKGFGSTKPIGSNDSKEGRKLNRRIEVLILKVDPGYNLPAKKSSKVEGSDKKLPAKKNLKPVPEKNKKQYHRKGHRSKNRVTIGGK